MKEKLKTYFSLLLLISFSWQCISKSFIYVRFKFNQKELSQTVCENRNKPKSCCAAKCQLDKEIKKEDKRQSDSSSPIKDKTEKSELKIDLVKFEFTTPEQECKKLSHHLPIKTSNFLASIFHPPCISCLS